MRVLHLITGIDVGGAEQYLLSILRLINRKRFEVSVSYLRGRGALRSEFEELGIAVSDFSGDWWSAPVRGVRLWRFIEHGSFDIVHTHLIRATLLGRILARLANVRTVFTTEHNVSNWRRKYFVVTLMYRWTSTGVKRFFAVSKAVSDRLIEIGRIPPDKVEVLAPGLDLRAFSSRLHGSHPLRALVDKHEGPILGCVARLDSRKGQSILIEAAAQLRRAYPNVKVILVGEGETRKAIESQVNKLDLRSSVCLLGTRRDVRELLKDFDVVVLPSLTEGLPVALLEAMAMGSLIVASRVGGIPEAIRDGIEGRLVEPGDPRLLAAAIQEVLTKKSLARKMRVAARIRCRREYDVRTRVRRLEEVYEQFADGASE